MNCILELVIKIAFFEKLSIYDKIVNNKFFKIKNRFKMVIKKENNNGVYIGMFVNKESSDKLKDFCEQNNININLQVEDTNLDFHLSLLSSMNHSDDEITINKMSVKVKAVKWEILDRKNEESKCLVLKVKASALDFLHNHIKNKYKLCHNFDDFLPHITIDYNFQGDKPNTIPDFHIQLNEMYVKQNLIRSQQKKLKV